MSMPPEPAGWGATTEHHHADITSPQELKRLLAARTREIAALEHAAHVSEAWSRLERCDLYRLLNEQVAELLDVEACALYLYHAGQEILFGQVPAVGMPDDAIGNQHVPFGEHSPARQLLEREKHLIIHDLESDPLVQQMNLGELVKSTGSHSTLIVGLRHEGRLLGAIQASDKRGGSSFSADDVRLLSIFANQAAITLKNAQLLEESQRHAEKMASLYKMALTLAEAADLDETMDAVLAQVRRVLDYDTCLITLANASGDTIRIQAVDGLDAQSLRGIEFPAGRGINAWIYREGKPLLIGDADVDPRRLHIEKATERIRAAVGAPLITDGKPIGTIYAARYEPYTFTEEHLDFLTITATQVAAAVYRAQLLDQTRQRAEEMETLYEIGAVMASSLDVEHVLQTIYEQAGRIMDTSAFFVALYDADSDRLDFNLIYDRGIRVESFGMRLAETQGLTAHVIRSGQPLLIRNWEIEQRELPVEPLLVGDPTLSWLGVPMIVQDRVLGAIGAQSYQPFAFTNRHMRLLSAIANQAGISLQNAKLLANLKLLNTDLQEMVNAQAHLLQTIEEMIPALDLKGETQAIRRLPEEEARRG
jgi:GAF domain-containing protein